MADTTITSIVNTPSDQVVNRTGNNQMTGTNKFGSVTDYTQFDTAGHQTMVGNATTFRDEKNDALNIKVTGVGLSVNATENTIDYTTTALYATDYAYVNVQLNHDRKLTAVIYPHLHWFQAENNVPNFILEYRWQLNGGAKTTAWTPYKCNVPAFTYTSGTIMQICYDGGITPPANSNVSDIIQFRIGRDTNNTSTLFTGADPYTTTVGVLSFDVHIETDSIGSNQEYVK